MEHGQRTKRRRGAKALAALLCLAMLAGAQIWPASAEDAGGAPAAAAEGMIGTQAEDWGGARWVWSADDDPAAQDVWMMFRRDFTLDEAPASAPVKVAADTKYWMHVNGEEAVWEGGLIRGPTADDTYYDTVDIAKYLKPGQNSISVEVWYWGNTVGHNNPSGMGGLLLSSGLVDAATGKAVETGDGEWWAMKNPANSRDASTGGLLAPWSVVFDGRAALGWQAPAYGSFAADGWEKARVIGSDAGDPGRAGGAPWNALYLRPIPQWRDHGRKALALEAVSGGAAGTQRYRGTLPYNAQFVPYIVLGPGTEAGLTIRMQSETYSNGNQRATYITKAGAQEHEGKNWINGDYIYFDVPPGAEVLEAGFRETGYDVSPGEGTDFIGYFDSVISEDDPSYAGFTGGHTWDEGEASTDNNFYDELWKKAVRTLYVTMRDTFIDCPDRERGQYVGDAVNEFEEAYYSLGPEAYPLIAKCLREIFGWQYARVIDGRTYYFTSNVRPGRLSQEIGPQVLTAIYSLWDYYKFTGDEATVQDVWQNMYNYLTNWDMEASGQYAGTLAMRPTSAYISSGYAEWCDWGNNMDVRLTFNLFWYMAARTLRAAADVEGVPASAEQMEWLDERTQSIAGNFEKFWREDLQGYATEWSTSTWRSASALANGTHLVDDRVNALAVVSGLAPASRYPAMRDLFLGTDARPAHLNASIYMEKYVQEALYLMGEAEGAMKRMSDRHLSIVNREDSSTLPEQWTGGTKNHGWSGGSMIAMSRRAAGVEPLSDGYAAWRVVPQMGGFQRIETRVPAVIGDIDVELSRDDAAGTLDMKVTSPGASAQFWVPLDAVVQEARQVSGPAAAFLGVRQEYGGSYAVYEAAEAGAYAFQALPSDDSPYCYVNLTNAFPAAAALVRVNGGDPVPMPARVVATVGQEMTLEAIPQDPVEYSFTGWGGDAESGTAEVKFTPQGTMNLVLNFKANFTYYDVTATAQAPAGAEVLVSVDGGDPQAFPASLRVRAGTEVTLEAFARNDVDYRFAGWSGAAAPAEGAAVTVVAGGDLSLVANFASNGYESIAVGAEVTASGSTTNTNWAPARMVDGILVSQSGSLGWTSNSLGSLANPVSGGGSPWVQVDLGEAKTFGRIHVYPRTDTLAGDGGTAAFATEFVIEARADESGEWFPIVGSAEEHYAVGAVPFKKPLALELAAPVTARYIRMTAYRINATPSDGATVYWQIAEFGVYAAEPYGDGRVTLGVVAPEDAVEFILEDLGGAAAQAPFALTGEGVARLGAINVRLSYDPSEADGVEFALGAALAGKAEVRVVDVAEPAIPGRVTKSVYILATGQDFSAPDGAALLDFRVALKPGATLASLALSHADAVYYDPAVGGGAVGLDAEVTVSPAAAAVAASYRSRFDANGDGKVTLADVNQVRQYLGSAAGGEGWALARTSDIDGDGAVGLEDLTLVIAAYEATVG